MRGPSPRAARRLIAMGKVESLPALASLADLLRHRAEVQPDDRAYVFLSERGGEEAVLTFAELERRACVVAGPLFARRPQGRPGPLVLSRPAGFYVPLLRRLGGGRSARSRVS